MGTMPDDRASSDAALLAVLHMRHPSVVAAQGELDRHLAEHDQCGAAVHQRDLCPDGQRLHSAVVQAAQDAYRVVHAEAFAPEPHDG